MSVPRLTRPSFYPPRDPSLRDNWRGRVRADQVTVEFDKVHLCCVHLYNVLWLSLTWNKVVWLPDFSLSWWTSLICQQHSWIAVYTLCLKKKVPTFKLSVTLSNLNRFLKFLLLESVWNLLQNPYNTTHLTLSMLLHYLGILKIQIFCKYSADMEKCKETAFSVHRFLFPLRA